MRSVFAATTKLTPSIGLNVVITWANGWTTVLRCGQTNSKCWFGCQHGVDALRHYLDCNNLHEAIIDAALALHHALELHEPLVAIRLNRWDRLALPHFDDPLSAPPSRSPGSFCAK